MFYFFNYLLQNYPKLEIAWIDMFEEIKDHLFSKGRINEVIEFVDNYRSAFPGEYESEYEFIERDLITHLFYKGDIDSIKERLAIIKANPVHGCDTVAKRVLFQLLYHEQFDLALEYSNALWKPLFETEDLMGYPYAEFSVTIYLNKLEDIYCDIKLGKKINIEGIKKEVEGYGFNDDKKVFEVVLQNLVEPLDKNTIASKFQDSSRDLLLTMNSQFLKYMKEKFGTPFILSDRFWNILQKIDLFGHNIEEKLNNYLKLYILPERIQQEIDAYNEEKLKRHEENRNYNREPPQPYVNTQPGVGRNDPCPCGSGKKYKKCCLGKMGE